MDLAEDPDHEALAAGVRAVCAGFDDDYWAGCDREHRSRSSSDRLVA